MMRATRVSLFLFTVAMLAGVMLVNCANPTNSGGSGTVAATGYTSANIGAMKYVAGGSFQRDATAANKSSVSAFRMSSKEITRAQYTDVMGKISALFTDPSATASSSGTSDPVQSVTWRLALMFCNKLSMIEGLTPVYTAKGATDPAAWFSAIAGGTMAETDIDAATANWSANGYRLPTEAEWRWAAMGATDSRDKAFSGSTGGNLIANYAWTWASGGYSYTTHPVGTKLPNELGIYDMSGNVWEWCWDWYQLSLPSGQLSNYRGPDTGASKVNLGGGAGSLDAYQAVNNRVSIYNAPGSKDVNLGFRVVRN